MVRESGESYCPEEVPQVSEDVVRRRLGAQGAPEHMSPAMEAGDPAGHEGRLSDSRKPDDEQPAGP